METEKIKLSSVLWEFRQMKECETKLKKKFTVRYSAWRRSHEKAYRYFLKKYKEQLADKKRK